MSEIVCAMTYMRARDVMRKPLRFGDEEQIRALEVLRSRICRDCLGVGQCRHCDGEGICPRCGGTGEEE